MLEKNKISHSFFKESLVILIIAILSFLSGFLLVYFMLPVQEQTQNQKVALDNLQVANKQNEWFEDNKTEEQAIFAGNSDTEEPNTDLNDEENFGYNAGLALKEVPPGPTPDGIDLDGAPLYFKCWDADDGRHSGNQCDRLTILEKRVKTRLYIIDECKKAHSGDSLGILSLGANINFDTNEISFWSAPSSKIKNASKTGSCIREKLAGLPLHGVDNKFKKYRLFFTIEFFDPKKYKRQLEKLRKSGKAADVVMDRVNVRETPVDGLSLGRLSSGTKVVIIGKNKKGDWCHVITPAGNKGWMICESLKPL